MVIRAVVFDIGGVLERVGPMAFLDAWADRLRLTRAELDEAVARVDPDSESPVGRMSEDVFRAHVGDELGLTSEQSGAFMADFWDWYCGELDDELVDYARSLRPAYRTAILSNSGDGARREEEGRYAFHEVVETIVYSHEIGVVKPDAAAYQEVCDRLGLEPRECAFVDDLEENIEGARRFGMAGVRHTHTPTTIAELESLLGRAAERCAHALVTAVRRVPAGTREEDDPEVQLALSDAVATGSPHDVLLALARSTSRRSEHVEWGLYVDQLRRTGVHRGLSARCRHLMTHDDVDTARELWATQGKRALWWFAHVQADLEGTGSQRKTPS